MIFHLRNLLAALRREDGITVVEALLVIFVVVVILVVIGVL